MSLRLIAILGFIMLGCAGGYSEGVSQKAEKGFLKFTGATGSVTVSIDDSPAIVLEKLDVVYEVKPGKHSIKAFRNGKMIVDRVVVVDNQVTMEVSIP